MNSEKEDMRRVCHPKMWSDVERKVLSLRMRWKRFWAMGMVGWQE